MIEIQACNVTIMITDMEVAIDFYVNTLGFQLLNRYGNHWADLKGPGINIGLHPSDKKIMRGTNLQMALGVEDIDTAVKELKEKGIEFNRNDETKVRLASFHDPDGNALYLAQSL